MNLKHVLPNLKFDYEITEAGVVTNPATGVTLTPTVNSRGHTTYGLRCVGKKHGSHTATRARLMALAFIPNPLGLPEVDHLDNNKDNDALPNLEWCTRQENIRREYERKGRRYTPFAKIEEYRLRHANGETWRQIHDAEKYIGALETFSDMVKTRVE